MLTAAGRSASGISTYMPMRAWDTSGTHELASLPEEPQSSKDETGMTMAEILKHNATLLPNAFLPGGSRSLGFDVDVADGLEHLLQLPASFLSAAACLAEGPRRAEAG